MSQGSASTGAAAGKAGPDAIFVVGYMHSGTSLLQAIVGGHGSVYAGKGESHFFEHLPLIRRRFADLGDDRTLAAYVRYVALLIRTGYLTLNFRLRPRQEQEALEAARGLADRELAWLVERARQVRDHVRIFELVFGTLARWQGKDRWLEKTPGHLLFLDQIMAGLPGARCVELVRDPRAVLASKRLRHLRGRKPRPAGSGGAPAPAGADSFRRLASGYHPFWDSLGWKAAVRAGAAAGARHPERLLRVRYEDLVSHPDTVVPRICDFLELPFTPALLDVAWVNAADGRERDRATGIGTGVVDRWREDLPPAAVALCQRLAGAEMARLDYAPVPVDRAARLGSLPILVSAAGEFARRLIRRWRLGGPGYALDVLGRYGRRAGVLFRRADGRR